MGVGACDKEFTHVADIKNANALSNGQYFIFYRRVLYGHIEAGKRSHLGLELYMFVIKGGCLITHGDSKFRELLI